MQDPSLLSEKFFIKKNIYIYIFEGFFAIKRVIGTNLQ